MTKQKTTQPKAKRSYHQPKMAKLGQMAKVTRKTGSGVDGSNPNQRAMN